MTRATLLQTSFDLRKYFRLLVVVIIIIINLINQNNKRNKDPRTGRYSGLPNKKDVPWAQVREGCSNLSYRAQQAATQLLSRMKNSDAGMSSTLSTACPPTLPSSCQGSTGTRCSPSEASGTWLFPQDFAATHSARAVSCLQVFGVTKKTRC